MGSMARSDSDGSEPLIALGRVVKRYGRIEVLNIGQLSVFDGEALALIGKNGSGKSTLLRLLAGITIPSEGRVERSPRLKGLCTAYVPQTGGLYPHLSVLHNLRLYANLYGRPLDPQVSQQWYIAETGLTRFLDYPVAQLSGGYFHLAALACGLSVNPKLLLLDEPFSSLDRDRAGLLADGLKRSMSRLAGLVITGHQTHELEFCDRAITLSEGRLR